MDNESVYFMKQFRLFLLTTKDTKNAQRTQRKNTFLITLRSLRYTSAHFAVLDLNFIISNYL